MLKASLLARAAVATGLLLATPAAEAQDRTACADRTLVIERLAERYGETLQSMGLHQNRNVLEVYASDETGTWTILVTSPDGRACLIAAGQAWDGEPAPLGQAGGRRSDPSRCRLIPACQGPGEGLATGASKHRSGGKAGWQERRSR